MKKPRLTIEEKKVIINMFNAMPVDSESRYTAISKKVKRSASTVFTVIKNNNKIEPEVKYFNPKIFQF